MAALSAAGCARPLGSAGSYLAGAIDPGRNSVVFDVTDIALQCLRDQLIPPPLASRALAMGHVAGFWAVNGIAGRYEQNIRLAPAPPGADPQAAYASAALTAFAEHFQQPLLFDRMDVLSRIPAGHAKEIGRTYGRHVGKAMVRYRTNDGAEPSRVNFYLARYPRRQDALRWRPTMPQFASGGTEPAFRESYHRGLLPGFGKVTPWVMPSADAFLAPPFLHPQSPEFAEQYAMVKELGAHDSRSRSKDETQIAFYWEDGPWGVTPPGHFCLIAMMLYQHLGFDIVDEARAMALTSMAVADAGIATWNSKYVHDIIRPETAIRYRAPEFRNPDPRVRLRRDWKSLIPTPPFPAYTSGHSAFGAAAMRMIANICGRDDLAFSKKASDTVIWPTQLAGVTRHWPSLWAAAEENGMSRIYGGVHWMADNVEALRAGRAIADLTFKTRFRRRA